MSSDSSDDENLELLKEAQDAQFINDSMFRDHPEKAAEESSDHQKKQSLPSLRPKRNEDNQFNFLKVTPEFRTYVAKQLSAILDRKLNNKFVDLEPPRIPTKKHKKSREGIKLLSESKHFIDLSETESVIVPRRRINFNRTKNNSDITEETLKEVAVSAEDILSQKEVKNWSKRTKAPVFHYKKTNKGQLELVEPMFK